MARISALQVSPENTNPSLCYPLTDYASTTKNTPFSLNQGDDARVKKGYIVPPTGLPISGGDQVNLAVSADEAFEGIYEVSMAGELVLPLLGAVRVGGLTLPQIQDKISQQLVRNLSLIHI